MKMVESTIHLLFELVLAKACQWQMYLLRIKLTPFSEGINPVRLEKSVSHLNAELCRIQIEIQNLQHRV